MSEEKNYWRSTYKESIRRFEEKDNFPQLASEAKTRGFVPATLEDRLYLDAESIFLWRGGVWVRDV